MMDDRFPRLRFGLVWVGVVLMFGLAVAENAVGGDAAWRFGQSEVTFGDDAWEPHRAPLTARQPVRADATGLAFFAVDAGPQVAMTPSNGRATISVDRGEQVEWTIPVEQPAEQSSRIEIVAEVSTVGTGHAEVELALADGKVTRTLRGGECVELRTGQVQIDGSATIALRTRGVDAPIGVRWSKLRCVADDRAVSIPVRLPPLAETIPPPKLPDPRAAIAQAMIQWDWRLQDGIGTPRQSRSWSEAVALTFERGDRLIEHLAATGAPPIACIESWETARGEWRTLRNAGVADDAQWERLWRQVHALRRRIVLSNPLADVGPLLLIKRVPSSFSHQLTQYAGWRARPGGGLFVLEAPGRSMRCRQVDSLPAGSFLHPDVSYDGRRVLFAFCRIDPASTKAQNGGPFYHLFEVDADGANLRQLTDGPFDDFSPRYLPDGKLLFVSTRRGGFHRCGRGPCPVYTLATADADGSHPRVVSFHETHEWDPAVLADGRVIYTRWDYVDRHAVHYQQLWTVRPDGSDVRAFYGNNTLNPVGVWEARSIPGSHRVMATAAAHHAMTAGSIIALDTTRGVDGLAPIERLTPDALFPESEAPVQNWHATAGVPAPPPVPVEQQRWPGHCYRTPYPLSDDFFLAAYSFEPLVGEPHANRANMFGIYLVDRFGNKELLYRDAAIGSLWPTPLRRRARPPALPSLPADGPAEGTVMLQDVYASWPEVSRVESPVKRLRIVQVLPKTTPHANTPRVGLANASPGKQVLGTVPVEPDGSALFRAPAGVPLAFQALDARGMAIQTMRSLTNLQPGEQIGCIGCHEHRTTAPAVGRPALATLREPSPITPGPDGTKPFNYAILVQPVLDKHCVRCHGGQRRDGGVDLTGTPDGAFTRSYNALVALVPFSEWKSTPQANHEPMTTPDRFGARASRLTRLLLDGHEGVTLTDKEFERLATWMDANALFYGTFEPADQQRQQRGERIAGPALE